MFVKIIQLKCFIYQKIHLKKHERSVKYERFCAKVHLVNCCNFTTYCHFKKKNKIKKNQKVICKV